MSQTLSIRLPDARILAALVAGGIAADLVWELWARVITPFFVGGPLQPASLILSLFRLPIEYYGHAEALQPVIHRILVRCCDGWSRPIRLSRSRPN